MAGCQWRERDQQRSTWCKWGDRVQRSAGGQILFNYICIAPNHDMHYQRTLCIRSRNMLYYRSRTVPETSKQFVTVERKIRKKPPTEPDCHLCNCICLTGCYNDNNNVRPMDGMMLLKPLKGVLNWLWNSLIWILLSLYDPHQQMRQSVRWRSHVARRPQASPTLFTEPTEQETSGGAEAEVLDRWCTAVDIVCKHCCPDLELLTVDRSFFQGNS